jgi:hypothetical protein
MDSTLMRNRKFPGRALAALAVLAAACAVSSASAYNHVNIVPPIAAGPYSVACSNIRQDVARIAPGASASDYWEGRNDHYITDILAEPNTAIRFNALTPDVRSIYAFHAGDPVEYVAIVCYPTGASNTDPPYTLPGTGDVIPHMQQAGAAPKLINAGEYLAARNISVDPTGAFTQRLPLIVYSHGLTGSPISKGYVDVLVQLAAQGFMVAGVFHGDPRFSRTRVEDLSDFFYLLRSFDRVAEMELLRPVSLRAMTDVLLASAFAPGIDADRIGGFGASLGGYAMTMLAGARVTTSLDRNCSEPVHDPRLRAVVGYVPFGGYAFLPAYCDDQVGAESVNRPYLAMSGTNDTTAPVTQFRQALNLFGSSRYLVELNGGQHELRPEDVGDLFTWMVTFFNAYLGVQWDVSAMDRLTRMAGVTGGRQDTLTVDVHVPFPNAAGQATLVELYNPKLNHYFLTLDAAEYDRLVNDPSGASWEPTGQGFKAYPQLPPDATVLDAPVCRFDAYRRSGPASAFYTPAGAECETAKTNRYWIYRGTPWTIRLAQQQLCLEGFLGVNRAYNQGHTRNDPSHRYTTSDSTMREMEREGWIYEGMTMCARP